MPVAREMLGVKGDECQCGRRLTVRHCTSCGSTRLYARQNRYHTMMNGEIKQVDIEFRCQGCGHCFIESERQWCEAPPVGAVLAALKVQRLNEAKQRGEYLRPKEEKAATTIEQLLKDSQPTLSTHDTLVDEPKAIESTLNTTQVALPTNEPIPEGLTKDEYSFGRTAFIAEWTAAKIHGVAPTETVEEYVKRRFNGEVLL